MATGRVNIGGSGGGLNTYCQLNEPRAKEGIWIKKDAKIKKIIEENKLWLARSWNDVNYINFTNQPTAYVSINNPAVVNDVAYYFGALTSSNLSKSSYACKYDIKSDVWTVLPMMPSGSDGGLGYGHKSVVYGTDIYILVYYYSPYMANLLKFDTLTETYTIMPQGDAYMVGGNIFIYDDFLYVFGGGADTTVDTYRKYLKRYDLNSGISGKWEVAKTTTQPHISGNKGYVIGGYLYYCGHSSTNGSVELWRQDMSDLTLPEEQLASLPVGFLWQNVKSFAIGTDIYLFQDNKNVCVYDTITNTYTITEITLPYTGGYPTYNGSDFIVYLPSDITTKVNRRFYFESKEFDDGTFVIVRGDNYGGAYRTELISPSSRIPGIYNRFLTAFDSAYIYTDNALQGKPTTYYGDGTKWVKFRGE